MKLIDDRAQEFLTNNRSLGTEIYQLQKDVLERREKLMDCEIFDNGRNRRKDFEKMF